MLIRYFGAAQAAAGVAQEQLQPTQDSIRAVLDAALAAHPDRDGKPSLRRILEHSSLLLDETVIRNRDQPLGEARMLDVLPPFAGG
ncbi:MoaD/ThiS family protein [Arthrobacter roseus]|uniref:MoaD/ThiS family protein n=1 Tax=Arthrobacter roseus TaxID=136274 RepID=UPI00196510ED|nr:molybdopterin converting factor small subunit [Arthrobacter roseus]